MIKGYKVRLFPTKDQEQKLYKHINSCRYVWNWMLEHQITEYNNGKKHLTAFDMIKLLKPLKNDGEHDWLYNVSNTSLQRVCTDLQNAYDRFFAKISGFPKFKSKKRSKESYPVCNERFYFRDNKYVQIQSIGKVKYKTDFDLPIGNKQKFSNVRITHINNKWIISFGIECENQIQTHEDIRVGIDLGVKELAVVAYNDKSIIFHNINKSRRIKELEKRVKYYQHSISRKFHQNKNGRIYITSNNTAKLIERLKKTYSRLSNIRNNYIHQCTSTIVKMNPLRVVMEDLNIKGMMKNRHLSKSIQNECWGEFVRQMKYKCEWNNIEFIQADRYYPSSKTCSNCGHIHKNLKLKDRTFVCPKCGFTIDRDYQAALNLQRYTV